MHDEYNRGYGGSEGGYRGGGGGGGRRSGGGGGGGRGHDRDHRGDRGHDADGRGVPLSELDPALTEVSRKLIGCAIEVHKALGPGYEKSVYQKAVEIELTATGVTFKSGHAIPVIFRGQQVGTRVVDLFIENRFLVDLLALRGEVDSAERSGMRAALKAADLELGLIVNFAERRLKDGLVRVLNPEKLDLHRGDDHRDGPGPDSMGHPEGQ
jgi:GxxExxY protein